MCIIYVTFNSFTCNLRAIKFKNEALYNERKCAEIILCNIQFFYNLCAIKFKNEALYNERKIMCRDNFM